jgi:hypothetical protein
MARLPTANVLETLLLSVSSQTKGKTKENG